MPNPSTPAIQDGPYRIVRRTLTLGIVGFADAGKTEYILSLAAIDKDAIPGWEIIRVESGLQLFLRERINFGHTASTDVLESKFVDLPLLLLQSKQPIDGAIIQLELRASDYAGEVFLDAAGLSHRFRDEAELRKWKDEHFAGLLARLGESDTVAFFHHCLSPVNHASRLNYTLLLSQIANSRRHGPLPLILAVSRADELADHTGDPASLERKVAECLNSTASDPCDPARYPNQMKSSTQVALEVLQGMFQDLRKAMDGPGLISKALLVSSWGYRNERRPVGSNQRPNPLQPQGVHFVVDQAIQQRLPAILAELKQEREAETRRSQEIADLARRRRFGVAAALVLTAMLAGALVELYRNFLPS